jgi:hypothetical protein
MAHSLKEYFNFKSISIKIIILFAHLNANLKPKFIILELIVLEVFIFKY